MENKNLEDRDFSPLSELSMSSIVNVYIFVSDALRWDAVPDSVTELGETYRAVASGLSTPQAMPSIATGQYPTRHGVTWFNHLLPDNCDTIFEFPGIDTAFTDSKLRRPLNRVLGNPSEKDVNELSSPFLCVELDHGGHAPFPEMPDKTPSETMEQLDGDEEKLRLWYQEGVRNSADRFRERIDYLSDQEILEETLIIFTSDHGELLGEYNGFTGHAYPPTPELAYVPMTFIHDSLRNGYQGEALLRHTDIFPTLTDIFDVAYKNSNLDGTSLLGTVPKQRVGYSNCTVHPPMKWQETILDPIYKGPSIWDKDGGYVFPDISVSKRVFLGIYDAFESGYTSSFNKSKSSLSRLKNTVPSYLANPGKYGNPTIESKAAREEVDRVLNQELNDPGQVTLSDETIDRLENLGYR
jgi:hypothetical protein